MYIIVAGSEIRFSGVLVSIITPPYGIREYRWKDELREWEDTQVLGGTRRNAKNSAATPREYAETSRGIKSSFLSVYGSAGF